VKRASILTANTMRSHSVNSGRYFSRFWEAAIVILIQITSNQRKLIFVNPATYIVSVRRVVIMWAVTEPYSYRTIIFYFWTGRKPRMIPFGHSEILNYYYDKK
jgi:hypothetical protein